MYHDPLLPLLKNGDTRLMSSSKSSASRLIGGGGGGGGDGGVIGRCGSLGDMRATEHTGFAAAAADRAVLVGSWIFSTL